MSSKRYKKLPEKTKDLPADSIDKLLSIVKSNCTAKFDESIDLSFQINNKQKKGEINFIGDTETRIKEDYLRILRYFRFFLNYSKQKHKSEII